MHYFLLPLLVGCAEQASEEACASVAITELPTLEFAPLKVPAQARIIEIQPRRIVDGVLQAETCYTTDEYSNTDYNHCCPEGWIPLALGASGILCEELLEDEGDTGA